MNRSPWQHLRPQSLQQACAVLDEQDAAPIAGGTDLFLRLKQGLTRPRYLVDLLALPGMAEVTQLPGGALRLGAALRLSAIERSSLIARELPVLAEAARRVASPQVRNMGSLGGNLCQETMCWWYNRTPLWRQVKGACYKAGGTLCHVVDQERVCYAVYRSDLAPVLMSLEAEVVVQGPKGERQLPLEQLYSGDPVAPFTLARGELLRAVLVRPLADRGFATFTKYAHRKAIDYPLISVAVTARTLQRRSAPQLRLVLGAVDGQPLRVPEAEELLQDRELDDVTIEAAAALAAKRARPIRNVSFGAPAYRRRLAAVLTRRALHEVRDWMRGHG